MAILALKPSRLYSRFPGGSVGLALLLLRLVTGLGLVLEGTHLFTPAQTSSQPTSALLLAMVLVASALLLIFGLRTSVAGSVAAICTAGAALYARHHLNVPSSDTDVWIFLFLIVFFLSSCLALLGPGGYSLDARFSGWRTIRLSTGQSNSNSQKEGEYVDR
jgi:uncharacterized membrane protein YphA (DoxX/SURF4 family)